MKYDFTVLPDRSTTSEMAYAGLGVIDWCPPAPKEGFDAIPMWVADMNFATAPSICEEITKRLGKPTFGYFLPMEEYYDAIIRWQTKHNHVTDLKKENIAFDNGVLGGLIATLNTYLQPGDAVLVHSPTYIGFSMSVTNAGYQLIRSELKRDEDGVWRMDYADMDQKIKEHHIKAAIFCNPHNPTGRVWEREEMEQAMKIYRENDCIVVSDEIWSDLIMPGYHHTPLQSVNEDARNRVVGLYAPSKTFSIAGITGSYRIIYNPEMAEKVNATSEKSHYNGMNVLSMHALIGAYSEDGEEWLEQLLPVLDGNISWAYEHICANYPGVTLARPQGTYMLFLDCEGWCKAHNMSVRELMQKGWDAGVIWQDGTAFGGKYTIRMNLAMPLALMQEAFRRLDEYVFV